MTNPCCNLNSKQRICLVLGVTFGLWLFYVGINKWIFLGPIEFVNYIVSDFSKVSWLPSFIVLITAWIIIIAEPLLGLMLIASKGNCRFTWLLTIALMFLLLMGKTMLQDHMTVANIWQYLMISVLGLYLAEKTCCLCKFSCAKPIEGDCCDKKSQSQSACCSPKDKEQQGACCQ